MITWPLFEAAVNGRLEAVRLLIDLGADVDKEENGRNIFDELFEVGPSVELLDLLYGNSTEEHPREMIGFALGLFDNPDVMKYLIDKGFSPFVESNGLSVAEILAEKGLVRSLEVLLDSNLNVPLVNQNDSHLITYAAFQGRYEVVNLLIDKYGADVNRLNGGYLTCLHNMCFMPYDYDVGEEEDLAATVKVLAEAGVDFHIRDDKGCTALEIAENQCRYDMVQILQEYYIDK